MKHYFLNIRVLPRALTKMGHTCTSIKKERFFFDVGKKPTHLVRSFEDQEFSDITWANLEITDSSWN